MVWQNFVVVVLEMQYIDSLSGADGSKTRMGALIDNLNTGITLAFLAELLVRAIQL